MINVSRKRKRNEGPNGLNFKKAIHHLRPVLQKGESKKLRRAVKNETVVWHYHHVVSEDINML